MLQKVVKTKASDPIDVAVGARIRTGRQLAGVSQEQLGAALGITFQQIQKYEKGTNRVAPSRLARIAEACGRSVAWYYAGLEGGDPQAAADDAVAIARADMALVRDVAALSPAKRALAKKLVAALAERDAS